MRFSLPLWWYFLIEHSFLFLNNWNLGFFLRKKLKFFEPCLGFLFISRLIPLSPTRQWIKSKTLRSRRSQKSIFTWKRKGGVRLFFIWISFVALLHSRFASPLSLLFGELLNNTTPSIMKSFRLKILWPSPYYLESYFIIPLLLDTVVSLLPSPYYLESYWIIPLLLLW